MTKHNKSNDENDGSAIAEVNQTSPYPTEGSKNALKELNERPEVADKEDNK